MKEFLTTDEAATYLRLSERKLYELVSSASIPCTKVTGRWLFPKAALDRWVLAGLGDTAPLTQEPPPLIVGGSHDPLLEWALRESGCGLASLAEGSEAGLQRLIRREVSIAAIHLHRLDGDDEHANIDAVAQERGLHDAVVIVFARREQGLLVAPGNPRRISDIKSVAASGARMAQRPSGAGAQLLLIALLAQAKLKVDSLTLLKPVCATGPDVAQAIRAGRADCGIATRSVARPAGLDFVPLCWEHFDLVTRQRDYFRPGAQQLFALLRTEAFAAHARELSGYDVSETGQVRFAG